MFAHNNEEIDYFKLAVINAHLIKTNMGVHDITVVTDIDSLEHGQKILGKQFINEKINNIVLTNKETHNNQRRYKDTSSFSKRLPFHNLNRCDAYKLSPYDETILLDVDYLILSDALNACWGHNNELMMNWKFQDIIFGRKDETLSRLHELGITMYWATVVYFKRCKYAETFFEFVQHVKNNKQYYKDLYNWSGSLYRNDYSFSIAAHMIDGFRDKKFPQLPVTLYKSFDNDAIHSVDSCTNMVLYLEKGNDYILTRWKNTDIHIMNKWAINRVGNKLMERI